MPLSTSTKTSLDLISQVLCVCNVIEDSWERCASVSRLDITLLEFESGYVADLFLVLLMLFFPNQEHITPGLSLSRLPGAQ